MEQRQDERGGDRDVRMSGANGANGKGTFHPCDSGLEKDEDEAQSDIEEPPLAGQAIHPGREDVDPTRHVGPRLAATHTHWPILRA